MKLIFLGTNGWYDTETGHTSCALLQTGREHIVLDAGSGLYKLDEHIRDTKPVYLFLSHLHLDHVAGLHTLNKFRFRQGMTIYGPAGTKEALARLMNSPFTMPLKKLPTRIKVLNINEQKALPVDVVYGKLVHPSPCYGYRFSVNGTVVTYCTDTGLNDNLYLLGRNADLLILECAYRSGETEKAWGHLNPEQAAAVARDSGAKKLGLMHFDARRYVTRHARVRAGKIARGVFRNTFVAFDDMAVML